MFDVEYFDRDLDVAAFVRRHRRAGVSNSGLHVGDRARDTRDHARTVFSDREQFDGVGSLLRPPGPFDFHDPFTVHHQLLHVLAVRGMDRDTFAARDITDNVFAVKRIAATRAGHHQVVDTAHGNRIIAQTDETLDRAHTAAEPRLLLLV